MVSALFAISSVAFGGGVVVDSGRLEEFGTYRALAVMMNGEERYAVVDPLNQESFAMTDVQEKFGEFLRVKYLGLERDMKVADTFYRESELPRSVSDKKVSMVLGEDFFEKKIVGLDYFNESMQVFEPGDVNEALAWLKAGSPDEEPTVMRFAMTKALEDVWLTDQLKVGGEKWPLMPLLLDSYSEQLSEYQPAKWGELWEQYGRGSQIYSRTFWRDVEFGGQPLPFFIGTWGKMDKDLPGLRGDFCVREFGSRRALYDSNKHEIWYTQSSTLEHVCAVLSSQVFRFPVRVVGKDLKIGRLPRFDDSSGDGLCSGGTVLSVEGYSGDELVTVLLAGGEKRQALVRDLVMRTKQRITVEVMCLDGKKRSVYVNSLLSYGG